MRFRLAEIKKQGIQHETISDQSNSSNEKSNRNRAHRSSRDKMTNSNAPLGGVIGNGGSNSTHLPSGLSDSSSSQCTLSRLQNQSMNHPNPNMNHHQPANHQRVGGGFHPHMGTNGQKENFLPTANQNRYPIPSSQNNGNHPMVPNGSYLNRQMHPHMVKPFANGATSGGGGPGPNGGFNDIGMEPKNYTNGHQPIGHHNSLFDSKSLVGQMKNLAIRPPTNGTRNVINLPVYFLDF